MDNGDRFFPVGLGMRFFLGDVELFLNEGEGFKVFYKYLQGLEKKGENIIEKSGMLFLSVLYFFFLFSIN